MTMRLYVSAWGSLFLLALSSPLLAVTDNWLAPVDGGFGDGTRWSAGAAPNGYNFDAHIDAAGAPYTALTTIDDVYPDRT